MNLIAFTNNLKDPRNTSVDQSKGLEDILEAFPYFQSAHFLYLNGLKNQNSFKYNDYLKKTAAYTTDRSVLFDYITSYNFNFDPALNKEHKEKGDKTAKEKEIKKANIEPDKENKIAAITKILPIGKPLQFDNTETYSFSEWLQINSIKPIIRKESPKKEISESSRSNFDLIDNFISNKPKLKPTLLDINTNIATDSVTENESLMTETLAHVYLEQKKFQKAITAFTVLSLKYPEKSGFFANQIKAIQKLQVK
ncbi:MAG: hypothetical protein L3J34_07520 [Flavobacteriaceae bacterium]|nr:hypothetical protein [Flavobacteriaceae bacterium]